ncbi:30S ribosomal protein S2 [Candidatus Woesearchaeota archaeon]|nr:30S ribosomal protein S2 [Candidatus Woesearchaeota archaeon]
MTEKTTKKESREELLVPLEQYLKAGIHIGTKFKTKYMREFIYKNRPDGLYVLNLQKIDERIKKAAQLLAQYKPEDILLVCRRENGFKPVKVFEKHTGIKAIAGRYPPGMLTNTALDNYAEVKLLIAVDAWPDRNAIKDARDSGVPIVALCDTNNQTNSIDFVMPANNKGKKSLGLIFWILAREYLKNTKQIKKDSDFKPTIEDFTEE